MGTVWKDLSQIFALLGLAGFGYFMTCIPWTKITLGAFLLLVGGVFMRPYPEKARGGQKRTPTSEPNSGEASLASPKLSMKFKGEARFIVMLGGIILICSAIIQGNSNYIDAKAAEAEKKATSTPAQIFTAKPNSYGAQARDTHPLAPVGIVEGKDQSSNPEKKPTDLDTDKKSGR